MKEVIKITYKARGKDISVECFWDGDELMIDPSFAMSASEAVMCAGYDGVNCSIIDEKYLFVPSTWLEKDRPEYSKSLELIRKHAKDK